MCSPAWRLPDGRNMFLLFIKDVQEMTINKKIRVRIGLLLLVLLVLSFALLVLVVAKLALVAIQTPARELLEQHVRHMHNQHVRPSDQLTVGPVAGEEAASLAVATLMEC